MEQNHGYLASPYTGVGQVQRGQLERWQVAMTFQSVARRHSFAVEEFFLNLEGPANLFRFYDPSRPRPRGQVWRNITLARNHEAGERVLEVKGLPERLFRAFLPGDWIQIGHQLTKVKSSVASDRNGKAYLEIWPKLWESHAADERVSYERARGLFRFLSEPPSWEVTAGSIRPYSFKLTGTQEIITRDHPMFLRPAKHA